MPPQRFSAIVVKRVQHTDEVFDLILRPDPAASFDFRPGQFVSVDIPHDSEKKMYRAYSIASSPTRLAREGTFVLNIKLVTFVDEAGVTHVGRGSGYLAERQVGDSLALLGPAGILPFDEHDTSPLLLAGTGTGIAPLIAMTEYLTDIGSHRPVTLYFGVRHLADIFYADRLRALATHNSHFAFHIALSRPPEEATVYRSGRLPEIIAADHPSGIDTATQAYICGGVESSQAIRDTLVELGVDPKKIHVEAYG